jgi:hypothetical protein
MLESQDNREEGREGEFRTNTTEISNAHSPVKGRRQRINAVNGFVRVGSDCGHT